MTITEKDGKIIIEDANRDVLLLVTIAKIMKIDLRILLYLYDKYKEDVMFVFFMFSGMTVKFPSFKKLYKIIKSIDELLKGNKAVEWVHKDKIKEELQQIRTTGKLEIDLNDESVFCLGRKGIIEEDSYE